jgi:hypothetical protein
LKRYAFSSVLFVAMFVVLADKGLGASLVSPTKIGSFKAAGQLIQPGYIGPISAPSAIGKLGRRSLSEYGDVRRAS